MQVLVHQQNALCNVHDNAVLKLLENVTLEKNGTCLKLRCAMSIVVFFHYILITSVTIKPVSFSWVLLHAMSLIITGLPGRS